MGLFDSISDFFSGIGSALSTVLKNSDLILALAPVLAVVIPPPFDAIAVVALMVISAVMGVEEEPDKLGWQMNQAEKSPEDFDSFKEYKEYLDENYPFDQAKLDAMSPDQKSACRYAGLAGTMTELKETADFDISARTLGLLVNGCKKMGMDEKTTAEFGAHLAKDMGNDISQVEDAVSGTLDPDNADSLMHHIKDALGKLNGTDVKEPSDVIEAMRDSENNNL